MASAGSKMRNLLRAGSTSSIQSQKLSKKEEIEKLRTELAQLREQEKRHEEEISDLNASLGRQKAAYETVESEHAATKSKLEETEAERDSLHQKSLQHESEIQELQRRVRDLEESSEQERQDAAAELERTRAERDELKQKCADQEARLQSIGKSVQDTKERLEAARSNPHKPRRLQQFFLRAISQSSSTHHVAETTA